MLLMKLKSILMSISVILTAIGSIQVTPATAQIIPQPWVTLGSKDGTVTYGVGARFFDFGVELGTGPNSVTGVDALKFFSFPFVSPYAGVGIYGSTVSYSGGVQITPPGNTFFGVGYNSVRGINGQIGIKF
jgi:hypothetical protein